MNTFALILKNMRQRALSTFLTTLSVALGVALAIAVIIAHREGDKLFVQSDFGYNLIVGPKGDELRLVLNSAYGLGTAQSTIPYGVYDDLMRNQRQYVRWAVPFMVGDTWQGKRIVATSNRLIASPELNAFREGLAASGASLKSLIPAKGAAADTMPQAVDARRAKVPAALDELVSHIATLSKQGDSLDIELTRRVRELGESVGRAKAMLDPAKPTMTDAAALIANDAVDQLRLLASFASPLEYRVGKTFQLAQGRAFHARKFEGVIGAKAANQLNVKLGDTFRLEHGGDEADVHDETWTVVGVLQPTGTAMDDSIFIPIVSGWAVPEHTDAMEQMAKIGLTPEQIEQLTADYKKQEAAHDDHAHGDASHDDHSHDDHDHDDHAGHDHATTQSTEDEEFQIDLGGLMVEDEPATSGSDSHADHADEHGDAHAGHNHEHAYHLDGDLIHLELPEAMRKISGIFVSAREGHAVTMIQFRFRNLPDGMAVSPGDQMRQFFNTFMKGPSYVVLGLAILVTAVAAVSILVSIYNAVAARKREIAILRALGATRGKVLTLICLEAAFVGAIGAAIGLVLGHAIAGVGGAYLSAAFGQSLNAFAVSLPEVAYIAGVVVLAAIAGLVPASQAYRTSVATNLAGE